MKTALVAGGAGFIGSHLVDFLLAKNYHVIAVDNFVTGSKKNVAHLKGHSHFELIEHDIQHPLKLDGKYAEKHTEKLAGKIDEIYNLASPASPVDFTSMPIFILMTSSLGHKNMLDLSVEKKCPILITSTSEVYGDPLVHPQVETYYGNVNPIGIRGCYDEAKRFAEALSVAYQREKKADIRIARIFNTYGPRMNPEDGRIIPNFFTQALKGEPLTIYGDGSQTRSFCYVSDMVEGLYALMQSQEHTPVNIGNPIEMTVLQMGEEVNRLVQNKAGFEKKPLPENDPKQRRPDISKAKRVMNWEPKMSLSEGLSKTHQFFKNALN